MVTANSRSVNTAKLVLAAIGDLHDGASKDEISQHIEEQFSVPHKDFGEVMEGIREHRRRRRSRSRSGRRRRRRRRRRHH
ncbi:hypothetical protein Trydic_g23950 [Trypoxylus dichotomus]